MNDFLILIFKKRFCLKEMARKSFKNYLNNYYAVQNFKDIFNKPFFS